MSETADYDPGPWGGHVFSVRATTFAAHHARTYTDAVADGVTIDDVLPDSIVSKSSASLTVLIDVTGSMGAWPRTIASKLPYLDKEGQEYLGKDLEIGFGAIGDANHDTYPVQARPYAKGLDMEKMLKELKYEGGGGGGTPPRETYELAALYYARNVEVHATRPVLIIIGDEGFYPTIDPNQAKRYAKVTLPQRISAAEIFKELRTKFSVWLIRKPYEDVGGDQVSATDKQIVEQWSEVLDPKQIVTLPDPNRVVDVIFGLLAEETGRRPYFQMELGERQTEEQQAIVYKSLKTVYGAAPKALGAGGSTSTLHNAGEKGLETKSLI